MQGWRLQPSLRKLRRSRSLIMATYFAFLWCITILNLFRCVLQMARNGTSSTHATLWNALWLLTRFGELPNAPKNPRRHCTAHTGDGTASPGWVPDVVLVACLCRHDHAGGVCCGVPPAGAHSLRSQGESELACSRGG